MKDVRVADARLPETAAARPPLGPSLDGTGDVTEDFDDCPELWVEQDTVGFFVSGTKGLFRLRLTPRSDGLRNMQVDLRLPCDSATPTQPIQWYRPKKGKSNEFSVMVPPLNPGAYAAEVVLQFTFEGAFRRFAAQTELYVYPADSSPKQIADKIVVNITNDIKMGHASDLNQSLDATNALGRFADSRSTRGLSELLDVLKTEVRAYRRLRFHEVDGNMQPLPVPPSEARADRLTLLVGAQRLHLLAGNRVTLGRNRANRVVMRRFGETPEKTELLNGRISKFHCTIEHNDAEFVILDGATDLSGAFKRSTCGVFWQGRPVAGSVRGPVGSFPATAELGLAGTVGAYEIGLQVYGYRLDPFHCASCHRQEAVSCRRGQVPAVVLRRTDGVPETYVLLWACMDLGSVFPQCAGLIVCHEQGAFSWRSLGTAGWLTPGSFSSAGTLITVSEFAQYGL